MKLHLAAGLSILVLAACHDTPPAKTALKVPVGTVGLCVRTARDGVDILEGRVMRSSGDRFTDEQARKDVVGSFVPPGDMRIPPGNARGWLEWLPMEVDYGGPSSRSDQPMDFDCADLERQARQANPPAPTPTDGR